MTRNWDSIDGETPIDPSCLRDKSIRTRADLNIVEAENIRKAVLKYLGAVPNKKTAPFSYAWMLGVHKTMFCDVWTWAGTVRQTGAQIGAPAHMIGERLGGLVMDMEHWTDEGSRLIQAVDLHYRSVQIHPFLNGNGRWSRLLANIWLRRHGRPVIEWPDSELSGAATSVRGEYISAIRTADKGDMQPLIDLHFRYWPNPA